MATAQPMPHGFGLPASLRSQRARLESELPTLIKIAAHHAVAHPDDPIDDDLVEQVRQLALIAGMHMESAASRLEAHAAAQLKAREQAESRVMNGLKGLEAAAISDAFNPRGMFVYCLWGKAPHRPLYVGQSTNILARLGSHLGDRSKRPHIRSITLIRCSSYQRMMTLEARLIRQHQPPMNTAGCDLSLR